MVGAHVYPVIAQARAILSEPVPHPRPGHYGIEESGQTKHRQPGLAGDGAWIIVGDQAEAMLRRPPIQLRPARDKLIQAGQRPLAAVVDHQVARNGEQPGREPADESYYL